MHLTEYIKSVVGSIIYSFDSESPLVDDCLQSRQGKDSDTGILEGHNHSRKGRDILKSYKKNRFY